jgi:hypothetical protein
MIPTTESNGSSSCIHFPAGGTFFALNSESRECRGDPSRSARSGVPAQRKSRFGHSTTFAKTSRRIPPGRIVPARPGLCCNRRQSQSAFSPAVRLAASGGDLRPQESCRRPGPIHAARRHGCGCSTMSRRLSCCRRPRAGRSRPGQAQPRGKHSHAARQTR